MKRLSGVRLCMGDCETLATFYAEVMGMKVTRDGPIWRCGYDGPDADLILLPDGPAYHHDRQQRYWKIGITLPNVDIAVAQLRAAGVTVSDPRQFRDIGYMAHLADPGGLVIELLQHDFEGNRPEQAGDRNKPLGGGARIGQITLRTGDVAQDLRTHDDMTCLSIQDVSDFGFELYFLAYTNETPPESDITAVGNREWLWKRPYTTLELQHLPGAVIAETPAYRGLEITG